MASPDGAGAFAAGRGRPGCGRCRGRRRRQQVAGHRRGVEARGARRRHDDRRASARLGGREARRPGPSTRRRASAPCRSWRAPSSCARAKRGAVPYSAAPRMPRAARDASAGASAPPVAGRRRRAAPRPSSSARGVDARAVEADERRGATVSASAIGASPARRRTSLNAARGSRGASDTKKSLHEYASASAGVSGRLQIGMRADVAAAVDGHHAAAHVRAWLGDHLALRAPAASVTALITEPGRTGVSRMSARCFGDDPPERPVDGERGQTGAGAVAGGCRRSLAARPIASASTRADGERGGPRPATHSLVLHPGRQRHGIVLSPSVL